MHYGSHHNILVVGDDDFSFAASLATSLGSASNVTVTSPHSRGTVINGHFEAKNNMEIVEELGAIVVHEMMDIQTMNKHPQLEEKVFDRIVLKFPQSAFCCSQDGSCNECAQDVVCGLYDVIEYMLADNGEIHVTGLGHDDDGFGERGEEECVHDQESNVHTSNDEAAKAAADQPIVEHGKDLMFGSFFNRVVLDEERWIMHYNNHQKILLVGEGDFSFASCLATAFGSASNLTATSLDSRGTVVSKYSKGEHNLRNLEERGAVLIHQVDAGTMNAHRRLWSKLFDRIVFNFPHAGGTYSAVKESDSWYIKLHKRVVSRFFAAARSMLTEDGEVHVTHKTTHPYDTWNVVELAENAGLELAEEAEFSRWYYPGYANKKSYGSSWDLEFPVGEASTFIFRTCVDVTGWL